VNPETWRYCPSLSSTPYQINFSTLSALQRVARHRGRQNL
jgi:hypothetical protein